MSDDVSGSSSTFTKGTLGSLLINKFAVGILIPFISYVALQTVSRPYYTAGRKIFVETNCYQTIFIVNPGPWKTRNPEIEFPSGSGVTVIDFSRGVSVKTEDNKQTASMDGGLAPGCNFFITYKFTPNPLMDSSPGIVCDGKQCKDSPTIDLDITMYLLMIGGIIAALAAVFAVWECVDTKKELISEKTSNVNKALSILIERCEAQADVSESIHTLVSFMSGKGTSIKATPIKRENGKAKKP